MLISLVFLCAVVAFLSDTSFGRALREAVARFTLPRPRRGQVGLAVLLIVCGTAMFVFLKSDGLALSALASPDSLTWLFAVDAAAYLDIVALAAVAALALRLRGVRSFVRIAAARFVGCVRSIPPRRSTRAHRRPGTRPSRKSDPDDTRAWGAAFA